MSKFEYSTEVQEGIDEFVKALKDEEFDANKVAQFLVENMGNSALNAQLRRDLRVNKRQPIEARSAKDKLAYFIFKSSRYTNVTEMLNKIDLIKEQEKVGLPVEDFEKPNLNEFGAMKSVIDSVKDPVFKKIFEKTNNNSFKNMYENRTKAQDFYKQLAKDTISSSAYQAGDLMMSLTSKTTALRGRQSDKGHEGKLEEKFVSKYNHAAPIFIDNNDVENPTLSKSDVFGMQRNEDVQLNEILGADNFQIDPTKLVSKEHAAQLEKINYGHKKDKDGNELKGEDGQPIKITWQEVMKERYRMLSQALHEQQNSYMVTATSREARRARKILEKKKEEVDLLRDKSEELRAQQSALVVEIPQIVEGMSELKKENKKIQQSSEFTAKEKESKKEALKQKYIKLNKQLQAKSEEQQEATKKQKELKTELQSLQVELKSQQRRIYALSDKANMLKKQYITNDHRRLHGMSNWVVSAVTDLGHKKMRANDMRKLSEKMFYAKQDKRKMICSEFSARSISACMHQLNKMTAIDLQAQGLSKEGAVVVKNPIPPHENFNKLHPERLVKLLKEAKCINKLHNKGLEKFVQTENTSREKPEKIFEILPRKLYAMVEKAESTEKFQKNAKQAMRLYLKHAKVPADKIDTVMQGMDTKLDKIYKQYTKQPSGIKEHLNAFCNKVLEAVGLRTKDKEVKVALKQAASHALVSSVRKQQSLRRTASSKRNISAGAARNRYRERSLSIH